MAALNTNYLFGNLVGAKNCMVLLNVGASTSEKKRMTIFGADEKH